ncbi:GH32 C-terminal domain-containing protein, partial [Sunxiuqinia sp. A32]|uniref:GH32 C-terminal domain-containing protein n=1 Tax=Sunxiuqinia sp. A32 TaxID=3461496 RepID=UPI0040453C6C
IVFYKNKGFSKGREYNPEIYQTKAKYSLLSIESSYSSVLPKARTRAPEVAPFILPEGENLKLRVFIDKSVVEVFANGKQCVAVRVYPGRDDSLGVSLRSQGEDSKLVSLDAYHMEGIWKD